MSIRESITFLTIAEVKENSPIQINIDEPIIFTSIIKAQNIELQPILGSNLFDKLLTDIDNDSLGSPYLELIRDYIKPVVREYTLVRALPFVYYNINRKGINTFSDEYQESVDETELNRLQNIFKSDAEFYAERLKDYLIYNSTTFPEYQNNTDEDIHSNVGSQFESPIYLPDYGNYYPDWYGDFGKNNGSNE